MFGFLNCNKPVGFTSRDLVNVVQGRLRGQKIKIGHCGTLDPLADGVLVVGVGPAAKLVPYVHQSPKTYHGTFQLAAESPTGDLEVAPTFFTDHPVPSATDVEAACGAFVGNIRQTPPVFSAIKIDGKRAYDLAREGKSVNVPERTVQIHELRVLRYDYPELSLQITCSTGTYIRTLGIDLAKALGTVAVMTKLTRTSVGEFELQDALSLERIRSDEIADMLQPATRGVAHLPTRVVSKDEHQRLCHGLCLALPDAFKSEEAIAAVTESGELCAILTPKGTGLCPKKVFLQLK